MARRRKKESGPEGRGEDLIVTEEEETVTGLGVEQSLLKVLVADEIQVNRDLVVQVLQQQLVVRNYMRRTSLRPK